ncbi:MAG: putative beta-lysine N-acetyltransferase [Bacillus sp. (in: Bacteria)]|nr:putative beta-lysine N-acetyltransferase [Bacillus sp. (in: firmicutes)]
MVYTLYGKKEREVSISKSENSKVLTIVQEDNKDLSNLELTNFSVSLVVEEDLEELVQLFKIVFPLYPTDIFDPNYLRKAMKENYTFMVAKTKDDKIVGVASAMESGYGSAEITDCAVHPDYRGNQLLHGIILGLEKELVKKGIDQAYSLTRAKSVGMNMTVKRLGYHYEGTLINNCIISTGFEDMNIWTKSLRKNAH